MDAIVKPPRPIKTPPFSHAELLAIVRYDPDTGQFWPVVWRNGIERGRPLGWIDNRGYRRIGIRGRSYQAHRLAWFYVTGDWPALDIDHKNRTHDDNRFDNLRLATHSQNMGNRKVTRNGLKGVRWNYNGWQAEIRVEGRRLCLGTYPTELEAHEAYARAAREHRGEFARTA